MPADIPTWPQLTFSNPTAADCVATERPASMAAPATAPMAAAAGIPSPAVQAPMIAVRVTLTSTLRVWMSQSGRAPVTSDPLTGWLPANS